MDVSISHSQHRANGYGSRSSECLSSFPKSGTARGSFCRMLFFASLVRTGSMSSRFLRRSAPDPRILTSTIGPKRSNQTMEPRAIPSAVAHLGLDRLCGPLLRIAGVPIDFARHPHDDAEQDEERDGSHEERVILLTQGDVEKSVNADQPAADHQGAGAAAEEVTAIPRD